MSKLKLRAKAPTYKPTCFTPDWATDTFPPGTDLVLIDKRWWFIIWNDEFAMSSPDPDTWLGPLDDIDRADLIPWEPPNPVARRLVIQLAAQPVPDRPCPSRPSPEDPDAP